MHFTLTGISVWLVAPILDNTDADDGGAKGNTEQLSEGVRQLLGLLAVEAFPFPSENCPSLPVKKGIWEGGVEGKPERAGQGPGSPPTQAVGSYRGFQESSHRAPAREAERGEPHRCRQRIHKEETPSHSDQQLLLTQG